MGDLPAYTEYDPHTGRPVRQCWNNGRQAGGHREGDKPSDVTYCPETGNTLEEWYEIDGSFHRDADKPAIITWSKEGAVVELSYWKHGLRSRHPVFGPAIVKYDRDTGLVSEKQYWKDGVKLGQRHLKAAEIKM